MSKYSYRPTRLNDPRLTIPMIFRIKEHSQLQIDADFKDFGFQNPPKISEGMVRIILEAAMIEYPELFMDQHEAQP